MLQTETLSVDSALAGDNVSSLPRGRILIVDDINLNRDILRRLLRKHYDLEMAEDGRACIEKVVSFRPQLVLLDVMMPGESGYEVCRRIKQSTVGEFVQVILVTGKGSTAERLEGYAAGADDYVVKPFDHDELLSKVRVQFRLWAAQRELADAKAQLQLYADDLESQVAARTQQVIATQDMAVFALAQLSESRDSATGSHLVRMRFYAQSLAEWLGDNGHFADQIDRRFLADLFRASPLHDVGKVAIPDSVLKKPGKLTPDEIRVMQQHVLIGAETLQQTRDQCGPGTFMDMAVDIARCHHERFDGRGYCAGLAGEEIPLAARIVALADVYDALTTPRVYKPAFDPLTSRQMIVEGSGTQFDPHVVTAFEACFDLFAERWEGASPSLPPAMPINA